MSKTRLVEIVTASALACMVVTPALAQKSENALRVAIKENVPTLSTYEFPNQDTTPFVRELYATLLSYDETKKVFKPGVVKSWKRLGPTQHEFDLRDDLTFHNGNKMTADDAVYTMNWAVDPKTKMYLQFRYTSLIKQAEKTGPYTFIVHTVEPSAVDYLRLLNISIYDAKVHAALEEKVDYGRKGIGVGAMKLVSFDPGRKFVLGRADNYKLGERPSFDRLEGHVITDSQTQVAHFLTGGIDLLKDAEPDQITDMVKRPNVMATIAPGTSIVYLRLDAINRTGKVPALKDVRVRRAIAMAIDKTALIKAFSADPKGPALEAMCTKEMAHCTYTVKNPYDPDGAKRLLKEAGFSDSIEFTLNVRSGYADWAQAIAGELHKVGIKMNVNQVTDGIYRSLRNNGQEQAGMNDIPIHALPDAHAIYQIMYANMQDDYTGDNKIHDLGRAGLKAFDPSERGKIYSQFFDHLNAQGYSIPITLLPASYLHPTDLVFNQSPERIYSASYRDFNWKK